MTDNPREACGIFGVFARGEDVARVTFFGLYALQHRGQESAGIATTEGSQIRNFTGMGLVSQVFNEDDLSGLRGHIAIGHTRYSTTGSSRSINAQPIVVNSPHGQLAVGHNGNITNARELRDELTEKGCEFRTSTDSEVIAQLLVTSEGGSWIERAQETMRRLKGAYSLVALTGNSLIGIRDPMGVRPLCLGLLADGWVLASESCALDHIGAQFIREVEPGEIVVINDDGVQSYVGRPSTKKALCIFEYIYFARPDSIINRRLVYLAREAMGAELSKEYEAGADVVIAVPDSATAAGIGFAQASGIPFSEGLLKNRYVGRTFIQPDQRIREAGVKLKFNPLPEVLSGKRVIVLDDSIVRGTTTPRVISLLRRAGASEIHMRICAPPIRYPCFFGVDMATKGELIAAQRTVPEIEKCIGATSLGYLSIEGLIKAVGLPKNIFCLACFTGDYPIPVQLEMDKLALETARESW